jgi:hypothetical protein
MVKSSSYGQNLMSQTTDGAEVLALWSNRGLTGKDREKKRRPPLKRAAKSKRAAVSQQLALNSSKREGTKRQTS